MKIKRFNQINEAEVNQIPGTNLDRYYKWYKMWCDENGYEYNFANTDQNKILAIGKKYAKDNGLPNMRYYDSEE